MQLVQILATKINPTHFGCSGGGIVWFDENGQQDENSIYKTPENLAIVQDVIDNYAIYEAEYLAQKAIDDSNAEIIRQIDILDLKRIRPLVEGDIKYLETYNNQITELRALLK